MFFALLISFAPASSAAEPAAPVKPIAVAFVIEPSPADPPACPRVIEYLLRRTTLASARGRLIDVTRWRRSGAGADAVATLRIRRGEIQVTAVRAPGAGTAPEPYRGSFPATTESALVDQAALAGTSLAAALTGQTLAAPAPNALKESALPDFERALACKDATPDGLFQKRCLLARILNASPEWVIARLEMARTMLAQGDAKAAAETLTKAIELEPDDPELRGELALASARLGLTAEALSNYTRALARAPHDPVLHNNFAAALIAAGQLGPALAHARRAAELEPLYPDPLVNAAACLRLTGRERDAEAEYRRAIALAPREPGPRIALARLLLDLGDPPRAQETLEPALDANPDHAPLLFQYALVLATRQNYPAAIQRLTRVLELDPAFREARYNLGLCHHYMGRQDEAIRIFEQSIERESNYGSLYYGLGLAYEAKKEPRLAEEAFKMALEKEPQLKAADAALRRLRGESQPTRLAWPWGLLCGGSERKDDARAALPALLTLAALFLPAAVLRIRRRPPRSRPQP